MARFGDPPIPGTTAVATSEQLLREFGVSPENSDLISASKEELENATFGANSKDRMYGTLPYFDKREEALTHIGEELAALSKHYDPSKEPAWRNKSYAEGVILFEIKFGKRLSEFTAEILAHYPDLHREGRLISIFGLSGSGKSTAIEAYREHLGSAAETVVIIDNDTVRYNLFAKLFKEAEFSAIDAGDAQARASKAEELKQLIHNRISGSLYFLLNHVLHELKNRGYIVFMSSTQPTHEANETIYVEHPDGIDVKNIPDDPAKALPILNEIAASLYDRTQSRIHGKDNYDWGSAETITDFNKMRPVTVQVPKEMHVRFAVKVAEFLKNDKEGRIKKLRNPVSENIAARNKNFVEQLDRILSESTK